MAILGPNKTGGFCECGCGQKTRLAPYNHKGVHWIKGQSTRFIRGHHQQGQLNGNWRGGRSKHHVRNTDYWAIRRPSHPRTFGGGYVLEHTLIAEATLGRYLPDGAQVHHIDGNGLNNERSNLVVCENNSYHMLLHRRQKSVERAAT